MTLPAWVRARGLAAFVVVFMGGMALGSVLWGQVATRIGIPPALTYWLRFDCGTSDQLR